MELALLSVALSLSVCPRLRVPSRRRHRSLQTSSNPPTRTTHSRTPALRRSRFVTSSHTHPTPAHQAVQPAPGLMKLRGGMSLGPLNPGNFEGGMKVAAAITAAGAVTSKYADVGETQLTKLFSGDVWNTNLIISIVTGVTSTVVYSVGGSAFGALPPLVLCRSRLPPPASFLSPSPRTPRLQTPPS